MCMQLKDIPYAGLAGKRAAACGWSMASSPGKTRSLQLGKTMFFVMLLEILPAIHLETLPALEECWSHRPPI